MNRKKLLTSILVSIFLSVSMVSIICAEQVDSAGSKATTLAGDPIQYWKNGSGQIIGVSDLGNLVYLEMPAGYEHIRIGTTAEGWGVCYDIAGVAQPPLYENYFQCSENQVGPGICDIYQVSLTSNKGLGGASPATAALISGTLKVKVVTKDILQNFKFVNSIFWKTSRSRVDIKTTITNISGFQMTNVLYRRHVDIDTDAGGSSGFGSTANDFIEQSRSVSGSNDKSVAPAGSEAHIFVMSGDPKPTTAEVAESCCLPDDLTTCSGYLLNNPVTPDLGSDRSGVLEWDLGSMANLAGRTRTTTYSIDEDMRK